jgi:hypothetical protein
MATKSKAALQLKRLRECAGFSVRGLATALKEAGSSYGRSPSSYAYYENEYRKPYLPMDLVDALAPLLCGKGAPPIKNRDVLVLAGTQHDILWIARPIFPENIYNNNDIIDPDLLTAIMNKIAKNAAHYSLNLTHHHLARMTAEVYARLSTLGESERWPSLDREAEAVCRLARTLLDGDGISIDN